MASTNAEIYKWVDQNGQVRYSDKKPNRTEFGSLTRNVKEKQERSKDKIQKEFDKHKGRIYRLYLNALRNDPSLNGMVDYIIQIEPNGKVSSITVALTTLDSKSLIKQVAAEIQKINFGDSEVRKTITHFPIHFFPAERDP